jgi:outer membrane protein TolC
VHDEIFNPTDPLLAVPFPVDLQDSWTRGMRLRPDLQQARLDLERQGITLKYYRNQMLPQLDVTGSYGFAASGALQEYSDAFGDISRGDKPFYAIGGVFSIPLENKAARSRVKQSKLNVQQALLTLKKLEENALVLIDEAAGQLNAAFKQVESSREARIYAEAALEAEQKKLTAGKSTSYLVLQFQRDLTAARSAEIQALSEYNKDRSQLFLQEGTTLERRGIKVQVK